MQSAVKGAGGVLNEIFGDVLRFPLWWYTTGIIHVASTLTKSVHTYSRSLGIAVWIRNIFVPMFGQHDWQSRIISVFMRSVQIIGRGIALLVYCGIVVVVFALYVSIPLVAGAFTVFHLFGWILQ